QAKSYLWAQVNGSGPPVRMFSYSPGRGAQHAQKLYAGVQPDTVLMTDGYELYNGIAHDHQLVHLGCWAHVRRGFIKAEESVPKAARSSDLLATRFVKLIGKLFTAEARSAKWTPERRQRLRTRYSARVLSLVERMMVEHLPAVVPSSLLGKALQYMSGQWPKLVRYIENGNWPLSNNLCENAIRPFVVGRKGWLFSDTVAGAQASANLYSLVETYKANGIEPYRYLVWLFTKLPLAATADDYAALMPWSMPATPNL
ncbi:IS66 family transposase, partial [Burkholderia cepacia]